ncbi:MAG: 6-phosphofructokinase [Anaerolineae bacterium]
MARLAILTSGGDSPGINAAIEATVRHAAALGAEVLGVERGFAGLADEHLRPLTLADVDGIAARGGTILGTSRDRSVAEEDGRRRMAGALRRHDIDGVIVLGGDGSIRHGSTALAALGVSCVSIPCTIDNDVALTDRTLGFDSACNRAVALVDGIRDTGQALHGRMFVLETLGGDTGYIALAVAEAGHADAVLVPEFPVAIDHVAARMGDAVARQGYALAVASEGAGDVHAMAAQIAGASGHRVRLTSLGHAQRGGAPTFLDRWLAARFAATAVSALLSGPCACVTVCHGYDFALAPLADVAAGTKAPDRDAFARLNGL